MRSSVEVGEEHSDSIVAELRVSGAGRGGSLKTLVRELETCWASILDEDAALRLLERDAETHAQDVTYVDHSGETSGARDEGRFVLEQWCDEVLPHVFLTLRRESTRERPRSTRSA